MPLVPLDEFPALNDIIYLDSAATSHKPQRILQKIAKCYGVGYSNIHRSVYHAAEVMTDLYECARTTIAECIGAKSSEIIFTSGATDALNRLAGALCKPLRLGELRNRILISPLEHHANFIPWQVLAEERGYVLEMIPLLSSGEINKELFLSLLDERVALVSLSHVSHVTGALLPVSSIVDAVKRVGALFVLDGAQSIAHMPINLHNLGCDFFCFSGHKVYGPTGIGVLWGKEQLLAQMDPWAFGGSMVDLVAKDQIIYQDVPHKFEAGTMPFVQAIVLAEAFQWLSELGLKRVNEHEKSLVQVLLTKIKIDHRIIPLSVSKSQTSLVSFLFQNSKGNRIHSFDVASLLSTKSIYVRSGNLCAQPAMKFLGIEGCLRVSLGVYNREEDIEKFVEQTVAILDRLDLV